VDVPNRENSLYVVGVPKGRAATVARTASLKRANSVYIVVGGSLNRPFRKVAARRWWISLIRSREATRSMVSP
jgi:hypothetical protein